MTAAFLSAAETASACSCDITPLMKSLKTQIKTSKNSAAAVFVGEVVSIRYSEEKLNGIPSSLYATIAVERSWKGPETEFIEVHTANICCICGFTFEVGGTYIVYSYSSDHASLGVTSCSRTSAIATKSPDEKYLGKARNIKKS